MVYPEIRHIESADLEPPALPPDPFDCEIAFQVTIGPAGEEGGEGFLFSVITAARLASSSEPVWGRGKLIVPTFEWAAVIQAVAKLLAAAARPTWQQVAAQLNRDLIWVVESADQADA